jgi:hypothetical protein
MFVRLKKAAVKVRDGERARQAERDGAIRAEQAAAERANCEVTYYKVYETRPGTLLCRTQIAVETLTACGRPSE